MLVATVGFGQGHERVGQVCAGHRPLQRRGFAGIHIERGATRCDRLSQHVAISIALAQHAERLAEIALCQRQVQRRILPQVFVERGVVMIDRIAQ